MLRASSIELCSTSRRQSIDSLNATVEQALNRKLTPELMDDPAIEETAHRNALAGLARLNRVSGVGAMLWREIRPLAGRLDRPLTVLDVATGSADVPIDLARCAARDSVRVELHACDISPVALEQARRRAQAAGVSIQLSELDAVKTAIARPFDVVTCSLFLHHLTEEQGIIVLRHLAAATSQLLLLSDLRRDRAGIALAWIASRTLCRSRIVHVDAIKSVRAAYTPDELRQLSVQADLRGSTVVRRWPRRILLRWSPASPRSETADLTPS